MSGDRKRYDYEDLTKGSRKKPRLDSPDQEISVHPFDDDFSGLEDDSPSHMISDSPNATLEPGVDISLTSPAFPLTKTTREPSKHSRRHYRGGASPSDDPPPQLTKTSSLSVRSHSKRRSHSGSRSPYSSEQSATKRRVVTLKRNSPPPGDFGQDSHHGDKYRTRDTSRPKHSVERPSRRVEYDSGRPREDIRSHHHHRKQQKSGSDFERRKESSRYSRDQDLVGRRRRSPPRREGRDRHSDDVGRRDNRSQRPRETKRHRSPRYERKREARRHDSGDEESEGGEESGPVGGGIEDLINDLQNSTSESSSDEHEDVVKSKETKPSSPESLDSRSLSSHGDSSDQNSPLEEGDERPPTDPHSDSEGEVHSPVAVVVDNNPYVVRSRFDSSDHSDEEEEGDSFNNAPGQQGHPLHPDSLEEGSGTPSQHSPLLEENADGLPSLESPSPPPAPAFPPYLPALMGCKNVESYEWLDKIEEGTYGVVYKAKDRRTGDIVALKKLKMEQEKEGFPITSLREINMLLKAVHPNIVRVREIVVGSNMDKIYIVMDFIKHDLKALMSTMKEKFLEGEVKTLMLHLLRAVHHMHENWILHRDLKTSNLLLSHDNILKVADFGLAREYGSPLLRYTPVVVTLWYRSPELLLGEKEYSTAVDIWSVGCIFAELLLHKPLFSGRSQIDQLNKIFTELGTPTEKMWPDFKKLSGAQNVTFTHHPQGNLRKKHPSLTSKSGFDLLYKLLMYDPKKRITAKDALDHQYFKDMPRPVPPEMFPTWPTKAEIAKNKKKREKSPTPPEGGVFVLKGAADPLSPGPGFSLKF